MFVFISSWQNVDQETVAQATGKLLLGNVANVCSDKLEEKNILSFVRHWASTSSRNSLDARWHWFYKPLKL